MTIHSSDISGTLHGGLLRASSALSSQRPSKDLHYPHFRIEEAGAERLAYCLVSHDWPGSLPRPRMGSLRVSTLLPCRRR